MTLCCVCVCDVVLCCGVCVHVCVCVVVRTFSDASLSHDSNMADNLVSTRAMAKGKSKGKGKGRGKTKGKNKGKGKGKANDSSSTSSSLAVYRCVKNLRRGGGDGDCQSHTSAANSVCMVSDARVPFVALCFAHPHQPPATLTPHPFLALALTLAATRCWRVRALTTGPARTRRS